MKNLIVAALCVLSLTGQAQTSDSDSPDALISATYEILTGTKGERDWDRFRNLFAPGATINSIRNYGSLTPFRHGTIEDYVEGTSQALLQFDFEEREIGRKTHELEDLVQVFSGFETTVNGSKQYGVNSIQIAYFENRWWIVHVTFNVLDKEKVEAFFN